VEQEKIAGSSVVLDRLNSRLSNFEEDPFFLKEQLRLFRWRLGFFHKFFPSEAIIASQPLGPFGPISRRIGWWWCPLAGSHLMPEACLVATKFSEVAEAAMNMKMDEDNPNGVIFKQDNNNFLGDDFYKLRHIYDWEIKLGDDIMEEGDQKSLEYLQRVLWALHKAGPAPLKELAARKVILDKIIPVISFEKMREVGFWESDEYKKWMKIQEEVPAEVLDYIRDGPFPKPEELNERGRNVWNALVKEAEERIESRESDEDSFDTSDEGGVS